MNTDCTHKQPNAENCFVCGRSNPIGLKMQFYDNGVDTVTSTLFIDDRYEGYPEVVHGGILASILDEVVARVSMIDDHHRFMMTVNLKVQYRHPVLVNTEIRAEGKVVKLRGRLGKAEGRIYLPDGTVACDAELTLADMPAEIATESRLASLGWKMNSE